MYSKLFMLVERIYCERYIICLLIGYIASGAAKISIDHIDRINCRIELRCLAVG